MAGRIPQLDLGHALPADVYTPNHSGDVPAAAMRSLEAVADGFAQRMNKMAAEASAREGADEAARDAAAGTIRPRRDGTASGAAYDAIARDVLAAKSRAEIGAQLMEARRTAGSDVIDFELKAEAIREGFKPTGMPEVDADVQAFFELQRVTQRSQVSELAEKRRLENARAGFLTLMQTEGQVLAQLTATTPFDPDGGAKISGELNRFANVIAKHGPKEGFQIGDLVFGPDETRTGALTPEDLTKIFIGQTTEARTSWILNGASKLEGSEARGRFLADFRARREAGDPMLAGLDPSTLDQLDDRLETLVNRAEVDERGAKAERAQTARDMIEAARWGADIDPEALRAAAAASGDPGLIAQADYAIEVGFTPPDVRGGSIRGFDGDAYAGGDVFGAAWGFAFEWEGGDQTIPNDNGRGPSRMGVNATANPDVDLKSLTPARARQIARTRYWNAIDGDRLPPDLAFVAFDAAWVAGPERAREWIQASGGDPAKFLALQEAHYRRLAAENPAKYGDDLKGWLNRLNAARRAAQRIRSFESAREGFATDPISYARGGANRPALASVPALEVQGAFTDDVEGSRAWGAALRQRYALGQSLSERYGVPERMLTAGEVQFYRDQLAEDPTRAVALGRRVLYALGPEGAGQFFREIGQGPGQGATALHLGYLSASGSDQFAGLAAEGLRLRAGGAELGPVDGETMAEAARVMGEAFRFMPDVSATAQDAGLAARLADETRGTGGRSSRYYLQGALGASSVNGEVFGGVAQVNGRYTFLPPWLNQEDAEDALRAIGASWERTGRGPVYSNGQPMNARSIAELRLVARPNGRYWLLNPRTGQPVLGREGRPFELDLDQQRDFLSRAVPGSVKPEPR